MNDMAYYIPAILRSNRFFQAPSTDQINPNQLPVSDDSGNITQVRSDGLYTGNELPAVAYYVNSSGTDATTSGTKAAPFQTLDYAIQRILTIAANMKGYTAVIALQSGQSFTLQNRYTMRGDIEFTYYGDTKYGDFDNNPLGTFDASSMVDLTRPKITLQRWIYTDWSRTGVTGIDSDYKVTLRGVQLDLPQNNGADSDGSFATCDFALGNVHVILHGANINKVGLPCYAGVIGTTARSRTRLSEVATVFTVGGLKVDTTTSPGLTARPHFIHFYFDSLAPGQGPFLFPNSSNSSNGSGLLELMWSDSRSTTISGNTTQETFPVVSNVQYGIRNYFTNLQRDQQSRPLNVWTGRLF